MKHDRIVSNPKVMTGKPVIMGTRITVELIVRLLGKRHSISEIVDAYPGLTEEDVYAAQAFAADYMAGERILAAE